MSVPNWTNRLDHIVALMFENRSFDNLLGYLYTPGTGTTFEGVIGRNLSNRIPTEFAEPDRATVPVHVATGMDTPDPDPGEEYPHVTTQLFDSVTPESNRLAKVDEMSPPFNAPVDSRLAPPMSGFVNDYINAFRVEMGPDSRPTYDQFSQIMACYRPEHLPVLSGLARGFACFDHWFCEVPSQTNTNR